MSARIDDSVVGTVQPTVEVDVERGRLRAFSHAIGETDPVYVDVDAARAAGHPDLPVPPTFLFGAGLGRGGDDFTWLTALGVDLRGVLHGSQRFTYHSVAHAGDSLRLTPQIVDTYEKKGGTLRFLVRQTVVTRVDGSAVADLEETIVVREVGS
ncbi:MaoC family dehydratase N-terminal domain-containing protein [Pseudonocardia sp. C8]|uniref:MaoC family dehydratase N-terminal domain-containing protein n=1 Tax=Pseudonocardia sp. C8 TaxID=2762759 RepID=UPI001642BFF3|nr:MaoC family dehydratase N-terminal domain-containing protein [Pseudonocardia sp. C8]MBC3191288.1 MaoC family dehydratase N-terminal domain-containing protein [Pseudonocardia sp. C8]